MARLGLARLTAEGYAERVAQQSGNALRYEVGKARRRGYWVSPFERSSFVPDIVDINHSRAVRSGGRMRGHYLDSVEELGGYPHEYRPADAPACPLHYDYWWGVFRDTPGHRQGQVVTDHRLFAYIRLRRNGDYVLYAQILGHDAHLRDGIMYALHSEVLNWLLAGHDLGARGVLHLFYGAWESGGPGLQRWKSKLLFEPAFMVVPESGTGDV